MINIIDTFKDFKICFQDKLHLSIEEKIELWQAAYISKYPELEEKLKVDYEDSGYSWRKIAEEMVFKRTREDFPRMLEAYDNILNVISTINSRAEEKFDLELNINIVLYAGLCNSAGWVDKFDGKRAILYGIDKIAELEWQDRVKISSLLSHELSHVVHFEIRGEDSLSENIEKSKYNKGIWNIYEEGFAQYIQGVISGSKTDSRGEGWTLECAEKEDELKKLYLEALYDKENGTKEFFGDWFKVLGISDAGYYLGSRMIESLTERYSTEEIAKLKFCDIEREVIDFLRSTAE